jgi:signal transduction histidine kinase
MPLLRMLLIVLLVNAGLWTLYHALRHAAKPKLPAITQFQASTHASWADAVAGMSRARAETLQRTLPIAGCRRDCAMRYLLLQARLPDEEWGVLLPFFNEQAQVFFNGHAISPQQSIDRGALYRHEVLLAPIAPELHRPGGNTLSIILRANSQYAMLLSPLYAGPMQQLRGPAGFARILGRSGHRATLLMVLPLLLVSLAMAMRVREPRLYLGFSAAVVGWMLTSFGMFFPERPLAHAHGVFSFVSGALLMICAMPWFADALLETRQGRVSRGFAWVLALGIPLFALLCYVPGVEPEFRLIVPSLVLRVLVLVASAYMLSRWLRYARTWAQDALAPWVLAFLFAFLSVGVFDAVRASVLWFGLWEVSLSPFGLLFLSAAFVLDVARKMLHNQARVENHVQELQSAVALRERELQSSFAQLRVAENERLLSDERRRITQDMHDGVAGTLSSLLVLARQGKPDVEQLLASIADGLDDLRLTIDALYSGGGDLSISLGALRKRLEARFPDVRFHWDMQIDDEHPFELGPRDTLTVFRIAQEAVHNAIRHGAARNIQLRLVLDGSQRVMEIVDDGQGFDPHRAIPGMGLGALRQRAESLGAKLEIQSRLREGTKVQVVFAGANGKS